MKLIKKILIINPPIIPLEDLVRGTNAADIKFCNILPLQTPLELIRVSHLLKKFDIETKIFDCPSMSISYNLLKKEISNFKPNYIVIFSRNYLRKNYNTFISCECVAKSKYDYVLGGLCSIKIAEITKNIDSNIATLVYIYSESSSYHEQPDFIKDVDELVVGNYESLTKILTSLIMGGKDIGGISVEHLNSIDREFNYSIYRNPATDNTQVTIPITRRCPLSCRYRMMIKNSKQPLNISLSSTYNTISFFYNILGIREFVFQFDNLDKSLIVELCGMMEKHFNDIEFVVESNPGIIGRDTAQKLRKVGCRFVICPIENGIDGTINEENKGMIKEMVDNCRANKIMTGLNSVIGMHYDNVDIINAKVETAATLTSDFSQIWINMGCVSNLLKDTTDFNFIKVEKGDFNRTLDYDRLNSLKKLQELHYRNFLLNPRKILAIMRNDLSINMFKRYSNRLFSLLVKGG